jgi:uncharacterized membrane protein (DUF485 family)
MVLGAGIGAAILCFFLTMLFVLAFSSTNLSYKWFGDEGSAWLGISIGLPLGLLVALIAFVLVIWRLGKALKSHAQESPESLP